MWSVQNRPKRKALVPLAVYGFLTTTTVVGGIVFAVVADRARVWWNARRAER